MRALRLAERWDKLLATVRWIDERQVPGMYLRQIDVSGIDTKFIERNKCILTELLDASLTRPASTSPRQISLGVTASSASPATSASA